MKVFLDTSVLVAGLVTQHPFHSKAASWLAHIRQQQVECIISAHSLAELYVTLSTMPIKPPLSPEISAELIKRNVLPYASVRSLNARQYVALIRRAAATGLSGGVIYDAIHAEVARRAGVDLLVSLNPRDFERVWTGRPEQLVSPLETAPP